MEVLREGLWVHLRVEAVQVEVQVFVLALYALNQQAPRQRSAAWAGIQ
jgi:hypothetical protein